MGMFEEAISRSFDSINGGLDVNIQDQTTPPFQYYLMNEQKKDITLTLAASEGDEVLNVSSGHGFIIGSYLVAWVGSAYEQLKVIAVATDAITVAMPISFDMPVADTEIWRGSIEMGVNGSVTPVEFKFSMGSNATIPIDINAVTITMQHTTAGDDSLFGGIAALTNGVYFRQVNGNITNLGNYLSNQDFFERGAQVTYTDKSGGGNFGTNIEFTLNGQPNFGIVLRVYPETSDYVIGNVRDNLSTLVRFRVSLLGSYTRGE